MESNICFSWREKIVIISLDNRNLCEIAIKNLPFLFHKKINQNIDNLFKTIKYFDEQSRILFVKHFRILMCSMYGKTINQNNKITCDEDLFCVDCDQIKVKSCPQICLIDDNYNKSLNEFWKTILLLLVNDSNTVIRCEVIKNIPLITNHFYSDSIFRNQMLMLINDKDEEVRLLCSKILNHIIFEKDSSGSIQIIESCFSQMMNILCSTVNNSLKYGNSELQYSCLETVFHVGW